MNLSDGRGGEVLPEIQGKRTVHGSPEPRGDPVSKRLGKLFGGDAIIVNRHPSVYVYHVAGPKANDL